MKFFKGPKDLLATAIADALSEYFVVDASHIESNLLRDAKIVLHDVELREYTSTQLVPKNSKGCSTALKVTGRVEEVAFTWAWGSRSSIVQDAKLTIKGLKFKARLEHGPPQATEEEETKQQDTTGIVENFKPEDESTAEDVKNEGGIKGYIKRQIEMMIDALTLTVVDFELTIEVRSPTSDSEFLSIIVGGNSFDMVSFGRETADLSSALRQTLTITEFCVSVVQGSQKISVIDPVGYTTELLRMGKRFGNFGTGLKVKGGEVKSGDEPGLSLHVGDIQIQAFSQLGVMVLAAPDGTKDGKGAPLTGEKEEEEKEESTLVTDATAAAAEVSSFDFSIEAISVTYQKQTMRLSAVALKYLADGSLCKMDAKEFIAADDNPDGFDLSVQGIHGSMTPHLSITLDVVDNLYIPGSFRILAPIEKSKFEFEGNTMSAELDTIEGSILKGPATEDGASVDAQVESNPSAAVPFPISLTLRKAVLQNDDDVDTSSEIKAIEMHLNPSEQGTQLALILEEFNNRLINVKDMKLCALKPLVDDNLIENVTVATESVRIRGGHSTDEWSENFLRARQKIVKESDEEKKEQNERKSVSQPTKAKSVMKLPNACIDTMKIHISYSGQAIEFKDVSFVVKPFVGKENTTSRDIINYYAAACLAKTANFVTNAEVLGLNIADTTAATYGAYLGMATPIGAAGGVALTVGIDAIKGTVQAGKRGRKASEEEDWRATDIFRGLAVAATESAQKGAQRRGKTDGNSNAIDWVVGASGETGKYVGENKSRLGSAGGAGVGMMYGTMLGGPVGGIVGGVVGGVFAGKSIDTIDKLEKGKKNTENGEKGWLSSALPFGKKSDTVNEQGKEEKKVENGEKGLLSSVLPFGRK